MLEGAEGRLGLPPRITSFVLPLAVAIFRLSTPVRMTVDHVGHFTIVATRYAEARRSRPAVASLFHNWDKLLKKGSNTQHQGKQKR